MDQALEKIALMRRQEDDYYYSPNHLYYYPTSKANGPDFDCRLKMSAWCCQVIDFCHLKRDTAEMAMNLVDRYLMTPTGKPARIHRGSFRLACMASLYLTIKSVECKALHARTFSDLSHGHYTIQDMEQEELRILQSVSWRVHAPTAMSFVRELMNHSFSFLLQSMLAQEDLDDVVELTELQVERAMTQEPGDNSGVTALWQTPPSILTYAAFMNSLAIIVTDTEYLKYASHRVSQVLKINPNCDEVLDAQTQLLRFLPKEVVYSAVCNSHSNNSTPTMNANPSHAKKKLEEDTCEKAKAISVSSPRSVAVTKRLS